MFSFLKSRDDQTIALGIEGKVSQTDAERLSQYVEENFGDDQPLRSSHIWMKLRAQPLKGLWKE